MAVVRDVENGLDLFNFPSNNEYLVRLLKLLAINYST